MEDNNPLLIMTEDKLRDVLTYHMLYQDDEEDLSFIEAVFVQRELTVSNAVSLLRQYLDIPWEIRILDAELVEDITPDLWQVARSLCVITGNVFETEFNQQGSGWRFYQNHVDNSSECQRFFKSFSGYSGIFPDLILPLVPKDLCDKWIKESNRNVYTQEDSECVNWEWGSSDPREENTIKNLCVCPIARSSKDKQDNKKKFKRSIPYQLDYSDEEFFENYQDYFTRGAYS